LYTQPTDNEIYILQFLNFLNQILGFTFLQMEQYEEAIKSFDKAIKLNPFYAIS
jgi:tetratricopeptide (TPR) repeat protein